MPFTSERALYLVNSGLYYMDLTNQMRRKVASDELKADRAVKILEDSNMNEDEKQSALNVLWESYKQLTDLISNIKLDELNARDILVGEAKYFDSTKIKKNDYHAKYMRRWREGKNDEVEIELVGNSIGKPINTKPRSDSEQEKIVDDLHQRLASEDKDSWSQVDLDARIAATVPKQSATSLLNQLVASKRVIRNRSTGRYEVEVYNLWKENSSGAQDTSNEGITDRSEGTL